MSWFPVGPIMHFTAFIIYAVLIIIILNRNSHSYTNRNAAYLLACFAFWSFGKMFLHNPGTSFQLALFIERADAIAWTTFPVFVLRFMLSLTNMKDLLSKKRYSLLTFVLPVFFVVLHWRGILMFPPQRTDYGWISAWNNNSIFPYLYYTYYLGCVLVGIIILLKKYLENPNILIKKQFAIIIFTTTATLVLGTLFEVIFPMLQVPLGMFEDITNIYILVWAAGIFLVIFRYRFLSLTPYTASESIISSMNEALILVNDDVKINFANKSLLLMLGYKERIFFGSPLSSIFYDRAAFSPILKSIIKDGYFKINEILLKKSDGSPLPCMFSASIIKELGEMRGIVCIATDITEQKNARIKLQESYERLKDIDTLKSNFTSMVSHELRTPITSIKGFIAFLLAGVGGPISPQQKDFLETIKNNSDRLLTLINDLLDTSKMESGSFSIKKTTCDLIKILDNSIKDVRSLSEKKNITVIKDSENSELLISADDYRISQAIINLINNAVKFSTAGSKIIVKIERKKISDIQLPPYADKSALTSGSYALIKVIDHGPGLENDKLVRVFDRYYQVENINTRSAQGTGLGLNIVKNIVELHGGAVWAESSGIGQGSTFVMLIPVN
jgi:PAS domain S-box-containing protein